MTDFVLDNSVSMRWLLASEKASDQKYAENVLESMMEVDALTPNLWHLEAISVLLGAEKRGEISLGEIERFISQLENLPIHVDPLTAHQAFSRTLVLSREYNISSYDASFFYLTEYIHSVYFNVDILYILEDAGMRVQSEIKKWGNSLALRITGAMADVPQFRDGTKVVIEVNKDSLIIKRATKPKRKLKLPYTEKELLEGMTPYTAHADELAVINSKEIGE